MRVVSQAVVRPHALILPDLARAAKYRPLALRLLGLAGLDLASSTRARARAIVGWVAQHAVHPAAELHPFDSLLNIAVLPPGVTWRTFVETFDTPANIVRDNAYWFGLYPDGCLMLERLVGTVAPDGAVADDGMLTEYAPGQWRIRDLAGWRSPQCTLQCKIAQVLLAAVGIHSADISTVGHDPMMFYEAETGRWLYIDPTFGEMQRRAGRDLGPLELLAMSLAGEAMMITGEKLPGADYLGAAYFAGLRMPAGMAMMTIHTSPQWAGGLSFREPARFGTLPSQSDLYDAHAHAAALLPELGCGVAGLRPTGTTIEVRLVSNWPHHRRYQRSVAGGPWTPCDATDYVAAGTGRVRYRSLDGEGFAGKDATLDL